MKDLELLIQLQEIDLRIKEQENAREQYPSLVADLENAIATAQKKLDSANETLAKFEKEKNAADDQVKKSVEALQKSQDRLNSIKTNREYDAVHAEIENQKNLMNTSESKKKTLVNEIEKAKKNSEEAKVEFEKIKTENEPKISELKEKIGAIDSNIAEIEKERNVITPDINKQFLRTYDLIRKKRKNGRAVSQVTSTNRTCTVCYKVLEPQAFNELKKGTRLTLCQSCGSILIHTELK